ncbi:chemotaxis protein CheW [Massilia sp. IC2-476]|uniref:chemotaxis protein CheW n=1 Tax=Massilia sp. IC2-476 TaxID=2887199 RepID=UPI001D12E6E2|nr:chemotaxis protein CheW [Massilia sp. IC2-476]MCC2973620.1 chemotaxis protein CheW [Massilia sp. IC2-476]
MASVRLAEARIGMVSLGVPIEHVVQAIAPPANVPLLPRRQGALWGVVEHLGSPVPVVELGRWVDVGAGPESGDDARILILREGPRTIGLRVDAVGGMVDVAAHSVTRLHHDDDPDEVFQSVAPGAGKVLSVLEVGRLADLAAAWTACQPETSGDAAPASTTPADAPSSDTTDAYAVLQVGAARLALPSGSLAEVIPMPALSSFGVGIEAKYCLWRNRHLPVLATGVLQDIAFDATAGLLAVIEHEGLALGLPVDAALELRSFGGPGLAMPDGCTAKVLDAQGNAVYLLDTATLFARVPEATLSMRADDAAAAAPSAGGRVATTEAYIVFEASGHAATPISAVQQVLDARADTAASASIEWNGGVILVIDLRAGSQAEQPAHGVVLVVQGPRGAVGFLVTRVHTMVPAAAGSLYQVGTVAFIHSSNGSEQASYRIVDLARLAAA